MSNAMGFQTILDPMVAMRDPLFLEAILGAFTIMFAFLHMANIAHVFTVILSPQNAILSWPWYGPSSSSSRPGSRDDDDADNRRGHHALSRRRRHANSQSSERAGGRRTDYVDLDLHGRSTAQLSAEEQQVHLINYITT